VGVAKLKNVPVDGGGVALVFSYKKTKASVPIKKGKYLIELSCPKCSTIGGTKNSGYVEAKADGFLRVADLGILEEYGLRDEELHKKGILLSTGGDGSFTIHLKVTAVSRFKSDPYKKLLRDAGMFFNTRKCSGLNVDLFVERFLKNVCYSKVYDILRNEQFKRDKKIMSQLENIFAQLTKT
jgi:hypothetical protein